ncbi:MAG: NAD-dependent epimerase/dehydratase family protein [Gemmatimonadetes bacterium]|nr:NAD-dependent epimerase/dehydratase family protein [Gemmatimonadota bacterium]
MSILLTGAAGFIGSHLSERLLARGESVVGLDSFDSFYDPRIKEENLKVAMGHEGFRLVRGDIRDRGVVSRLPDDIDTIIHLAARAGVRPSIEEPVLYTDVNVLGTMNLLELAAGRDIPTFLFASSSSVYGNSKTVPFVESDPVDRPISPYAATKKAGELLCHTATHLHGFACVCLRFFTVYGPRQRPDLAIRKFAQLMTDGQPIPMFGDGSTERDYTYIDDILDGIEGSLRYARGNPGSYEVVNLGESRTISLREMIDTVADVFNVEPDVVQHPLQPGDVMRTYADISHARELFGYNPTMGFREGVEKFAEWFAGATAAAGK